MGVNWCSACNGSGWDGWKFWRKCKHCLGSMRMTQPRPAPQPRPRSGPVGYEEFDKAMASYGPDGFTAQRSFAHTSPPPAGLLPPRGSCHPLSDTLVSITGPSYPSFSIGLRDGVHLWRTVIHYAEPASMVRARRGQRLAESQRRWASYVK